MAEIEKDAKFLSESVSNLKIKGTFTAPERTYKDATKPNQSPPETGNSLSPTKLKRESNPFGAPSQVKESSSSFGVPSQGKESSSSYGVPSQGKESSSSYGVPSQGKESSSSYGVPSQGKESSSSYGVPSQGKESSSSYGVPSQGKESSSSYGVPSQVKESSSSFGAPSQVKEGSNPFAAPTQVKEGSNPFATPTQVKESSNSFGAPSQVKDASNPFDAPTSEPKGEAMVVNLSDIQGDENSPLYSVTSFENLGIDEKILKGIYAMNFKKPSKIQEKALPILLRNPPSNMIAQSQSGTGKTAAFVITILSRLDNSMPETPQALVLAPSRELARQIEGVVRLIGKFMDNLTIQAGIPGAVERSAQIKSMVVVGTPGTVLDLIRRRQLNTTSLKILCLDEADNMLDMQGLGDQCLRVKSMLPSLSQILLFSATFPDQVWDYAREFSPQANEITLKKDNLTVRGVKQMFIDCPSDEGKYEILAQLYGMMTIGSSIIFVKRRETADRISERLMADGHQVVAVHGAYDGMDRDRILEDFRSGKAKVLITTNVLARGIDVSTVSMVINYDIPMKGRMEQEADPETYLHRIGRTGRFGRTGVSISFVFDYKSFKALSEIAEVYNIDLVRLDHEDWDQAEKVIQSIIKSSRKD